MKELLTKGEGLSKQEECMDREVEAVLLWSCPWRMFPEGTMCQKLCKYRYRCKTIYSFVIALEALLLFIVLGVHLET